LGKKKQGGKGGNELKKRNDRIEEDTISINFLTGVTLTECPKGLLWEGYHHERKRGRHPRETRKGKKKKVDLFVCASEFTSKGKSIEANR